MVWDMLVQEDLSYDVLFVGSKTNNAHNCRARSGTFDLHHEGHHGRLAINVANHYLEGWLASSKPDIVQIMLGSKDVSLGRPTSDIIDSYTKIIDLIRASNPRAKILVCDHFGESRVFKETADDIIQVDLLIPMAIDPVGIDTLNKRIPSWAEQKSTADSPITIADCSTEAGYTLDMNGDGTNPNETGDRLIANQIGPLLLRYVRDLISERQRNEVWSTERMGKGNEELK